MKLLRWICGVTKLDRILKQQIRSLGEMDTVGGY